MSRSERTRTAILDAAWRLFDEAGSEAVRVQDVADAAGVTRQTVYFHFDNRAKLLAEVARHVDEQVEDLPARAAPVWESESGVEAVGRFVELVADYYPAIRDVVTEVQATRMHDQDVEAAWRDRLESRKAACRGLVDWLDRDGCRAEGLSHSDATDLLTMLTSFGTWEDLTVHQGWSREHYVRVLTGTIRRLLVAPHQ